MILLIGPVVALIWRVHDLVTISNTKHTALFLGLVTYFILHLETALPVALVFAAMRLWYLRDAPIAAQYR